MIIDKFAPVIGVDPLDRDRQTVAGSVDSRVGPALGLVLEPVQVDPEPVSTSVMVRVWQ